MPELPDVEGFRRVLLNHVVGEEVTTVEVRDSGVIRGRSGQDFEGQLVGRRFKEPERRGKWLLAPADKLVVLVHFGMTGSLRWDPGEGRWSRHDRVAIGFGSGTLVFRDQRKLGGMWLAGDDDQVREVIGEQGPDALGLSGWRLEERLEGRRGTVKSVLMDQSVLAGLGNMLSDEVLWRARIHPARRLGELGSSERRELSRCLQQVLRASVQAQEIPRRPTWLSSQRSQAEPCCPRCRGHLATSRIGGRTSYWCPVCQPAPLAGESLSTASARPREIGR